jgi:hypothetical protein
MKNWSMWRLALVLWFAFYAFFAFTGYLTPERPIIFWMILKTTVAMGLGLLFVGFLKES